MKANENSFNTSETFITPFTPFKKPKNESSLLLNLSTSETFIKTNSMSRSNSYRNTSALNSELFKRRRSSSPLLSSLLETQKQSINRLCYFSELKLINRSSTAHIYSAFLERKKVAIKAFARPLERPAQIDQFLSEQKLLGSFRCPYVLRHHFAFLEKGFPRVVTEFCSLGTLRTLFGLNGSFLSLAALVLARKVATGLSYLHNKNVIHGDLCPENIFLSAKLTPKIGDFGLAQFPTRSSSGEGWFLPVGHKKYLPPERESKRTKASDVFSLGLVFLELFAAVELPESGKEYKALRADFIVSEQLVADKQTRELVNKMLRCKVEDRCTIKEVKEKLNKMYLAEMGKRKLKKLDKEELKIVKPEDIQELSLSENFITSLFDEKKKFKLSKTKDENKECLNPLNLNNILDDSL